VYPWVKEEVPPIPTPYTNYGRSPGPRGQQYDIRRHCQREAGLLNFRQQLRGCYKYMYEETVSIEPCLSNSLCVLIRCMATAELHQRTGPTCTFHLNNPTLGELGLARPAWCNTWGCPLGHRDSFREGQLYQAKQHRGTQSLPQIAVTRYSQWMERLPCVWLASGGLRWYSERC